MIDFAEEAKAFGQPWFTFIYFYLWYIWTKYMKDLKPLDTA